jgi:hypothetical protein
MIKKRVLIMGARFRKSNHIHSSSFPVIGRKSHKKFANFIKRKILRENFFFISSQKKRIKINFFKQKNLNKIKFLLSESYCCLQFQIKSIKCN